MAEKDIRSTEEASFPDHGDYDPAETRVDLQVPPSLSVKETEDWVAGDKMRAKAALAAESGKDGEGRSTLITNLEKLANDETGGIAQEPATGPAVTPGAEGTG